MKITKNQLKKILIKEFKNTSLGQDYNFDNLITGFPPIIFDPPDEGGGGGGGNLCGPGKPRYERIRSKVFNSVEDWMEYKFGKDVNIYIEYEKHLRKIVDHHGKPIIPMIGRHEMKRIIVILEEIVDYLCYYGGNMHALFNDPSPIFKP